jgi:hypothetical protein
MSRTRLALEPLEDRENPATLFTESFDQVAAPALPAGWKTWSSDGTAAFATAAGVGVGGSEGLISSAGSRTAALAWYPQAGSGDTGAAVSLRADSLVPVFVFARGTALDTSNRSYLAAVVTRGLQVQLVEVTGANTHVIGSVTSPAAAYLSGQWVRVSLVPVGTGVKVEVTRADTGQYLNAAGLWQTTETAAISATTTIPSAQGYVGVGRNSAYAGAVALDDFTVIGNPPVSPPPPPVPSAGVTQSFDATAAGAVPAGWTDWTSDSTGGFKTSSARALSPSNGFADTGVTNTAARSWSNTDLPADVDASAAVFLDSLVPAQVFARGTNLASAAPSYYAVNVTRGLQATLVKVVNGVETVLGSVTSSAYLSQQWVRTRLVIVGNELRVQLYRVDTRQWLGSNGQWSNTATYALDVHDSSITGGGKAGVGRHPGAAGTITVDDFDAVAAAATSGPQVTVTRTAGTGAVTGTVTFQATVTGPVANVTFLLNGTARATSATAPAQWTFDSTTVANGTYTLTVSASDSAGNVASQNLTFTVANPPQNPRSVPSIPQHYPNIRIAELAYSGVPVGNAFEQTLLKNSVDLVVSNPTNLATIDTTAPNTPQLIYSNVSNLYQGLLTDWLQYADRTGVSRELAFYHVTAATPFQGSSSSSQPVNWFWGVFQSNGTGTPTDVTSAARGGRNFDVQFGAAGTSTSIGYIEKFREMNFTFAHGATGNWSGVWEYATAVDASGNPTAWKTLPLIADGTAGMRASGRITFDPPADWVPSAMTPGGDRYYSVRFRVTTGSAAQGAELKTVFGRDYVNANGGTSGTIPAFDYSADKNHDGYLNDAEYATRKPGMDARFVYETRLFYPYYGQERFVTNPSSAAVQAWAADYHVRLLNATPMADAIFMDNATGKLPFAGISVLEPTNNFSADSGALMAAVSRAIAPRWVLANTAGGGALAEPIVAAAAGAFEESLLRPETATWSSVGDTAALVAQRLATPGTPYLVLDSSATGGSPFDPRTQMATLAYYYLLADPQRTFLSFYGGDSPSTSWTGHWVPAVAVDVGTPTGAMKVFATGADPANSALTYQVLSRTYSKGLVLYKPLSYAPGKGAGTLADNTATTVQLGGSYRVVSSTGTLGPVVTSVTLRNGEGAVLMKA